MMTARPGKANTPIPRYTLRFLDDYGSGWLWGGDAATLAAFGVGPLDDLLAPRLSAATGAEAKALSALNHASLDWDDPATPLPLDPVLCADFNRRAMALFHAMQAGLGPDFLLIDQFHRLTPG